MELREYVKIIRRHFTAFIIVTILVTLSTFLFTKMQPTTYTASTTFTVNKSQNLKQSQVSYYIFDNYYNVQSAGLFSQIVTTWFSSPSLVKEVYQKANMELPNVSQKKLAKTFKAVREEPATITVTISGTNKDDLDKLINAAAKVLQDETNTLGKSNESFYEIAFFKPIVSQNTPNLILNTGIGLVSGIILGVIIALGIAYFKEEK